MPDTAATSSQTVLHLTVNNHPGVLSHVCGLFARRAFNLEGVLVTPSASPCSMWLLVNEDKRMSQLLSQLRKLEDVLNVSEAQVDAKTFQSLGDALPGQTAKGRAL